MHWHWMTPAAGDRDAWVFRDPKTLLARAELGQLLCPECRKLPEELAIQTRIQDVVPLRIRQRAFTSSDLVDVVSAELKNALQVDLPGLLHFYSLDGQNKYFAMFAHHWVCMDSESGYWQVKEYDKCRMCGRYRYSTGGAKGFAAIDDVELYAIGAERSSGIEQNLMIRDTARARLSQTALKAFEFGERVFALPEYYEVGARNRRSFGCN